MSFLKLGLVLLVSLGVVSFSVLDRASEGIRGPDAEASHADSMAIGNQTKKAPEPMAGQGLFVLVSRINSEAGTVLLHIPENLGCQVIGRFYSPVIRAIVRDFVTRNRPPNGGQRLIIGVINLETQHRKV